MMAAAKMRAAGTTKMPSGGGWMVTERRSMTVQELPRDNAPKVREYAEITLTNGTVLTGHVFVEANARIQDLLNEGPIFFPFVDKEDRIHLLNKHQVLHVRPFDQ